MFPKFFKLDINTLVNIVTWIIAQLQDRALEKISTAESREEAAKVLLAEAEYERLQAKVALKLAENITKMLK